MQDIQDIFNRIEDAKKEHKELRAVYKDALSSTGEYDEVVEKIDALKARKKQIEANVQESIADQMQKMETMTKSMASDRQMLSDIALSSLLKGEIVKVIGANDTEFEPHFSVRFKKKP